LRCQPSLLAVIPTCATVGFADLGAQTPAAGKAQGQQSDKKRMIVTAFQDAKFVPADPGQPDGAQIAVLSDDPATGPSAMLLKFKKTEGHLHIHSSDYHPILKHWANGQRETDVKSLGPGSYWFQPGNHPHADSCLSDECLMFITSAGKRDAKLVEPSVK
jgi:hypothetical protein